MNILNWLYLKKQQLIKTEVNNAKTDLVLLGAEVPFTKRDDGYQDYAMTVENFAASIIPYKVYTALLSQTGTDTPVATVLENTANLGDWTRDGGGTYLIEYPDGYTPVIEPFGTWDGTAQPYMPIYSGFSGDNGNINGWYSIYPIGIGNTIRLDFQGSPLVSGGDMSDIMGTTKLYVNIKFYPQII